MELKILRLDAVMKIHTGWANVMVMITHDVEETMLLSDRIVMRTNFLAVHIGEVLEVVLARSRNRIELASTRPTSNAARPY